MNCVVYMDLRPFQCAQFLGGLKLYLQTILKAPVKFEKKWPKTVGGVAGRRMVGGADERTDGRMDGRTLKISEGIA